MGLRDFSKTYKPFMHPWAFELWEKHEDIHWTTKEASLGDDVVDWRRRLTPQEREYIIHVFRLFTQSDVQVGQNYYDYLIPVFKNNEVRNMLGSFANREATHQHAYALLVETLGLPDEEFHKFLEYSAMADKISFMADNSISNAENVALALAKSVASEGVSLFASFAMLLQMQTVGKMKGMCTIVEWSIRDETMHVEGNSRLFHEWCNEHPGIVTNKLKSAIYTMFEDVVILEDKFIELAYGDEYEFANLSRDEVRNYIRYMADYRLQQLGLKPIMGVNKNPIPSLDWLINGSSHDNFFEKRVTEYSVNGMSGEFAWPTPSKTLEA